jgi:hypothetical protein
MKRSFYNPKIHKGTQPVRVLSENIIYWFENTYEEFKHILESQINQNGLKRKIRVIIQEGKIREVAYISKDKVISIEETFLSYIWTMCYSLVVLFDEIIHKPKTEKNWTLTEAARVIANDAQALFDYGVSLLDDFSEWDKDLPNPELYDDENMYIEKTNGIFLSAINFVIVHEFAHVFLGHIDFLSEKQNRKEKVEPSEIKEHEYQADQYALNVLMKGSDFLTNKETVGTGIIIGLTSLIFFGKNLDQIYHPDTDERLKTALEELHLDDRDNLWGIACLAFKLWANHYSVDLAWPAEVDTYKELFYLTLLNLRRQEKKST